MGNSAAVNMEVQVSYPHNDFIFFKDLANGELSGSYV